MVEYGHITKEGYLHSKILETFTEKYKDENGETKERLVSIEEQASQLALQGWKQVDLINEDEMKTDNDYNVTMVPYDAGDRISYKYEKSLDTQYVKSKIKDLKKRLSSSDSNIGDYKITKCYEASLAGEPLPYDIKSLREERQKVRDEINRLEDLLINNK